MNVTDAKWFRDEAERGDLISREGLRENLDAQGYTPSVIRRLLIQMPMVDKIPLDCRPDCRWKRLSRWQKCSCCARNWRNLKDCYERGE